MLPFGIACGTFIWLTAYLEDKYRKSNLDLFWKKVIGWAICLGIAAFVISFVIHTKAYDLFTQRMGLIAEVVKRWAIIGTVVTWFQIAHVWLGQKWAYWSLVYGRAFAFVYVLGAIVEAFALKWRLSFWRAFNVIWPVVVEFPWLICKYWMGYQTPIQDKVLAGILKAKLRENLNDSYEGIDRGIDANGKPFQEGAGGSVQAQLRSAVNQAMKRTRATVKTTTDGKRIAHVLIRQSRETETDRAIEQVLKGWGERVSGDSIYFPSDPTYSTDEKGYIFDSVVNYGADEELGSYRSNFADPFSDQNKTSTGGDGSFNTFVTDIRNSIDYFLHLTPYALYLRHKHMVDKKYYRDTSADKAKFRVQQNLDLSVIPDPKDPESGRSIDEQQKLADQQAKARIQDVTTALSAFGLYGQFKDVQVGGNTAVYEYTLPPDAKLPSDFDKVQDQIGNILRVNEKPIITLRAGVLSVSMPNGVNIPVSFTDMIKKRSKGTPTLISGLIGEDALGKPLTFELGDSIPHCIIFGKTGTGKSVLIESLLYTIMSATDPTHLKILYIDGKGNSFEFMRADGPHPNPYTFAQPANASGDMNYARALIIWLEKECRRRIELFRKVDAQKLSEYNKIMEKQGKKILPELLAVIDEFSAITQQDKQLSASEMAKLNVVDRFEYLAKMARSVGIRMILANQSARKELVPGKISANIPGRISLGVSEPIEAEIALPETGIKVNLISQPGEFYSLMHGATNPEHGNGPYLPPDVMNALNDGLTEKFGKCKYVKTREQIFVEAGLEDDKSEDNGQPKEKAEINNQQSAITDTVGTANDEETQVKKENELSFGTVDANGVRTVKASEVPQYNDLNIDRETSIGSMTARMRRKPLKLALYLKANESSLIDHNSQMYGHNADMTRKTQARVARLKEQIDNVLKENKIRFVNDAQPTQGHPHQKGNLSQVIQGNNKKI